MTSTLQQAAQRVLLSPHLADKLAPVDWDACEDCPQPGPAPDPLPVRAGGMAIQAGVDRLPRLAALGSKDAQAHCLHRFANHELQALEMMAWAVLAFPNMPTAFRQGLVRNLKEEQAHMQLYLAGLLRHGVNFGDEPVTGNFWAQAPLLTTPLTFLCAMGLTFESANLDFSLLYRDAFARVGAVQDAAAMNQIHQEEVGHVAWALSWVRRLKDPGQSDLAAYLAHTPFPLGLHRSKGRNFCASARRLAGMDEAMIAAAQAATSPQQERPRRGPRMSTPC